MKYIFRGEVVFEYKEDTGELKTGIVEIIVNSLMKILSLWNNSLEI